MSVFTFFSFSPHLAALQNFKTSSFTCDINRKWYLRFLQRLKKKTKTNLNGNLSYRSKLRSTGRCFFFNILKATTWYKYLTVLKYNTPVSSRSWWQRNQTSFFADAKVVNFKRSPWEPYPTVSTVYFILGIWERTSVYYAKSDKISKIQLYNSNLPIHYQDR